MIPGKKECRVDRVQYPGQESGLENSEVESI